MMKLSSSVTRICAIFIAVISTAHRVAANPICTTPECKQLGDTYLKNMDPKIAPCTDFYEHVCHRWGMENPRPQGELVWDVLKSMQSRVAIELKQLLERLSPVGMPEVEQAQKLYHSCTNLPYLPTSDSNAVKATMTKIGTWPILHPENKAVPIDTAWWEIDNMYGQITGESAIFDIALGSDAKRLNRIVLQFKPLFSSYGMLKRSKVWDVSSGEKDHYKSFLYKIIEKVSSVTPVPVRRALEEDLNDIINFRELLRLTGNEVIHDEDYVGSIREIQSWYNARTQSRDTAKIDWLQKAQSVFKNGLDAYGKTISTATRIMIRPNYASKLATLLGNTRKRVIVNHIHLYFAERHVRLNPDMERELKQSANKDEGKKALRYLLPRWKWCILTHSMRDVISALYIGAKFPPQQKAEVESLFNSAKNLLQTQISNSAWLSADMKNITINVIGNIKSAIGYQEYPQKCSQNAEPLTLILDPIKLEMCHIPGPSEIYVSAANLQPPLYTHTAPFVIDYGSTVALLAHELYHAFSETGLQHGYGMDKPLWPSATLKEYQKHKKCFQDQYEKYRDDELKKYNLRPQTPLISTIDEDLADVMGLKLAYRGFKEALSRHKGVCHVLPGFDKAGCEKLFFIAFGNLFCASALPGVLEQEYIRQVHSSPRTRLNGAVANMKEFSDAFGCTAKDPLHIEKRCDLWQ